MADEAYAFPRSFENTIAAASGMTLRDYFAAQAVIGIISATGSTERTKAMWDGAKAAGLDVPDMVARLAYEIAMAMLKERAEPDALSEQQD